MALPLLGGGATRRRTSAAVLVAALVLTPFAAVPAASAADGEPSDVASSEPAPTGAEVEVVAPQDPPTVEGDAAVGAVLSLRSDPWGPDGVELAVAWFVDGVAIPGADEDALELAPEHLGHRIHAEVTGTLPGASPVTVATAETAPVREGALEGASPSVVGTPRVGSTLTAAPGTWSPTVAFAYHWLRDGVALAEATSPTYVLSAADLGATLSVRVTGSAPGYTSSSVTSLPTAAVTTGALTAPLPVVSGTPRVGSKLTAVPGAWTPGTALAYQWKVAGTAVAGATSPTFVPRAGDKGRTVTVTVTGTLAGYAKRSVTSAASASVAAGVLTAPVPTISGAVHVGYTLRATPGTWSPAATTSYQWKRDGVAIKGATSATYKLTSGDHAKRITVTVTGSRTGYTTRSVASAATVAVVKPFATTTTPRVTGTARVGSSLTVTPGTWSPAAAFTYQWKADGVAVPGATRSSFTVTAAQHGRTMTVTVTGRRAAYVTATRTSAGTAKVTKPFASSPAPTISGKAWNGAWLRASTAAWSPAASSSAYQWRRDGKAISGATSSSYRLTTADAGHRITVTVTGRRSAYATTSRTSAPTAPVNLCRVKGNADSGIYHVLGVSRYYTATVPEACFSTEAAAKAAGFRRAKV
ncbi:sunset domain-containing protein [Cellulosimicrobium sp. Marseille-Q8652]